MFYSLGYNLKSLSCLIVECIRFCYKGYKRSVKRSIRRAPQGASSQNGATHLTHVYGLEAYGNKKLVYPLLNRALDNGHAPTKSYIVLHPKSKILHPT